LQRAGDGDGAEICRSRFIACSGAALGLRVRRFGRPCPAAHRLIVANHVSWLDIPALGASEPMSFLAKKEVGASLLGRIVVALQGGVYIDRRRKRAIPGVNAAMAREMRAGAPVVLFAEATTGDGNRVLKFRSSHFDAARQAGGSAVIQPVFLRYCRDRGPAGGAHRPAAGRLVWRYDLLAAFAGVLRAGGILCEIHYGDPLPVEPSSSGKFLAETAERAVRALAERARATSAIPAGRETG